MVAESWVLSLEEPPAGGSPPAPSLPGWPESPPPRYERLYFGAEFCAHLFPSATTLLCVHRWARSHGLAFSVVTPPASDLDLRRLLGAMDPLLRDVDCEIVFNDWGLFRAARRRWSGLTFRMGRLLHRQMRDPRAASIPWSTVDTDGPPEQWRWTASGSQAFQATLDVLGVDGVDVDWPAHGLAKGALGSGSRQAGLHLSDAFVVGGRLCVAHQASEGSSGLQPARTCAAVCRGRHTEIALRWPDTTGEVRLVERGGAQFAPQRPEAMPALAAFAKNEPVQRLVVAAGR